ncbi:MAG: hypothetical protein H6956_10030 [Chromatiaceae bacterium]|nr:hypothetical protein [Chromatiaceae bacterium]MCP5435011.1 hypothetical protein [Chromatiaceae bacterium]MCW5584543.1 hypothetical protein [Chromatiales bacterium]
MKGAALKLILLGAAFLFARASVADNMIMARVPLRAEIVLEYVKASVEEHGYTVAHLQLCDGGMKDFGYESDFYRVVFFGKVDEVRMVSARYPELVSYLPLKIAVIAEKNETLLTVLNPEALAPFFPDEALQIQLGRWQSDLMSIFQDVRRAVGARIVSNH